jgi:hypothetical protein
MSVVNIIKMSEQNISNNIDGALDGALDNTLDVGLDDAITSDPVKKAEIIAEPKEAVAEEEVVAEEEIKDNAVEEILLKLGDIILISDPTNEILNDNVFLIDYIDPTKVKLINGDTLEPHILRISPEGIIGDGTISSIKIISSNPNNGFARQNGLLTGTWVDIYFGGDIPTIITGEITNLEEDMIEIKTTDGDTIFINFAYRGIPEDMPIETFKIRPPIKATNNDVEPTMDINELDDALEPDENELDQDQDQDQELNVAKTSKATVGNKKIQQMFTMDDIEFGDVIEVEEYVTIDKDKYRFNIETQTNDILEEMLSTIPSYKRTNNVLNNIHTMITRFLQLREISSTFDKNKNITGVIRRTAEDRPLAEHLAKFKNSLYWIMLVAKNIKKIYPDESAREFKRYNDYETIQCASNLADMSALFVTRHSARTHKTEYSSFTYQSFEQFMTPFYPVNIDPTNDVFAENNGIIVQGNVEDNIDVLVDNLKDVYSTVVSDADIANRRFIIQRYNLAHNNLHADSFKGQHLIAHRVKLVPNDPISINSIITLPESMVRFSQVNLPGSNLLVKANLNFHFLNYWQLLKEQTNLTKVTIDGLDNEIEYDDSNFVDNIKQYILDLSDFNRPPDVTDVDIYKIFLKTIIPKTKTLFSLVKKYIKGKLSLVDVVHYLEPFMIYPIDLTYMQFMEINRFIHEKIKDYNIKFRECSMAFSTLRHHLQFKKPRDTAISADTYIFNNPLFEILSDGDTYNSTAMSAEIMSTYGYDKPAMTICGSEFLKNITVADYGNLFNTAVAFTNIELMYPNSLSTLFNDDKERIQNIMKKDKEQEKCRTPIIAKQYYSMASLLEDNNKQIYYDKAFDTTNYDIVETKYSKERNNLSADEFIVFLTNAFVTKDKMDETYAEYMATTLANQIKAVRQGDYAILNETINAEDGPLIQHEAMQYYVRNNDVWELDANIDPELFVKQDDILCEINYECMYNSAEKSENKCETVEVSKDNIVQNALKQIINQFDNKYEISKDALNTAIVRKLEYYKAIYKSLQMLKSRALLANNNFQYNLGLSVKDEMQKQKVSPYAKIRDLILGQTDFVKRQTDILQFVSLYCYEGNPSMPNVNDGEMENKWWLYCRQTNTKLLPKFHYMLSYTFIHNNNEYEDMLDKLKRTIGKLSDDGDAWVDEHSGEIICSIDLDTSESYKDGYVDKSRDVLKKDMGDTMMEKLSEKAPKRLSPDGEIVSNVISILATNMGIDMENSRDFIVRVVTNLMSDTQIIVKEPAYRKREEEAAKNGKKIPSYGTVHASTILYLTLGMYLIGVQTSIPSIRTRKTAPGCVRSFTGFPFEGEGDDSSITYLACVALKSRDRTTVPWNVLPSSVETIVTRLKSFIVRYLLPYGEVERQIKDKTEYLLVNPQEFIPEEHDLSKWLTFLPPLKRFNVKHLQSVTEEFKETLTAEIYRGDNKQTNKLLIIQSKIIAYSLAIQEAIQSIVEKKTLLLKSAGQNFIDNACCNEQNSLSLTTLQYFISDNRNIEVYNNEVVSLSSLLKDVKILTQSAIMLSEIDTKRHFPAILNDFSEETIYKAFIMLCKFQSSIPLTDDLASICVDKPDYLQKMDTIQEKISKLKRDGRNYTTEQFDRLFQLVSRHNIINISLGKTKANCVDMLSLVLQKLDEDNDENVPKALTQKLENLVENYDVMIEEDTREIRHMKDYLQLSINKMRQELIDFLKMKAKLNALDFNNITKFIKNISIWRFDETDEEGTNNKISDDGLYNYTMFMKTYIHMFSIVFPTMIINQQMQEIKAPKYWGLSTSHSDDVKDMLSNYYRPIEKFYGNTTIKNVLNEMRTKSRGIYLLSQTTPILTNIKLGDKEMHNVFDKRVTTLLYEYYLLSVFSDYVSLTKDPSMITRMLVDPDPDKDELSTYSADFLVEQQMRFTEDEQAYIEGDVLKLNQEVAKLLVSYLQIMMRAKQTINVSHKDIEDVAFKLKEAEKYDFTDKLKAMTDDERAVDNLLKKNKLGALYNLGASIRDYDPDHYEHDKKTAENVHYLMNKSRKRNLGEDIDDALDEQGADHDIELDLAMDINMSDDYNDGDPFGDEQEYDGGYD